MSKVETRGRKAMIYAYYIGDDYIASGTADELAEMMGVKASTIQF